ncbi:MAG: response regulator [Parcubacteria group bacterium CG1_02_40_82]|uniref:Response regulator n=4 Tax=Candidatus Portnoyibacteriota TaxID=1817913 RepID=A0A2M7IIJ9_9BACT|nr:MAG: response regulator [Parcubacteria group bacterium CG1_02_40_82]PIQ75594.1 MAG: response regulator [Candidatus Portnoybacteria bacterium CG11_big_fil_rev_8_21_14_0_20_40_15]PIS31382.1 MAG: response regulator [Candidatus Portnoybacteria bacterium CG08_land_8_20_14_0_20_40_83]PIW76299.1 MAG: response regulator [Candidatus Portnoybacteria bacterium CG_4_8_14_3_um_filter_40_10]PJA64559.1 MAG: response regulator [Candidatus Portnoybacteria bacterium CG_4_9_14_3_um_filter_40_10]
MPKILIVEDDPFLSEMYTTKLVQENFEVDLAVDGKEAIKKAREMKPDLILLDIVLPKMDGFEVLAEIKKDIELRNIQIIALTNLGQKEEVEKGLKLGADDYIVKAHFTPTEVINKIKQVIKK